MRTSTIWKEWYFVDVKNNFMINANDLRIGNYILQHWGYDDIGPNSHDEIIQIPRHAVLLAYEDNIYSPIPLTPEILKSCGFENISTKYYEGHNFRIYEFWNGDFELGFEALSPKFKYLHQLQNLYFALTGEELKVNFNSYDLKRNLPYPLGEHVEK